MTILRRLARFSLATQDAPALAHFYQTALGFLRLGEDRIADVCAATGLPVEGGARRLTLGLGREIVELLQFERPGQPYPRERAASDLFFQHFAIVAADMAAAFARLSDVAGWTAISQAGPQRLPESSGGVTAFKFRDPEGHPLELLAYPAGAAPAPWRTRPAGETLLGVDHSAISVLETARSIAFYEGLGLTVSGRSLNRGPEQEKLDGVADPHVEVTALSPVQAKPHLELLRYRGEKLGTPNDMRDNDVGATRIIFEAEEPASDGATGARLLRDPDGHRLSIIPPRGRPA